MKSLLSLTILFFSFSSFADYVGFQCGEGRGNGMSKSEIDLSTESVDINEDGVFGVGVNGKEVKNLKGQFVETNNRWIYEFTAPLKTKPYNYFLFTGPSGCQQDGDAATVSVGRLDKNGDVESLKTLPCLCYSD